MELHGEWNGHPETFGLPFDAIEADIRDANVVVFGNAWV